jgi:hypothetical protein
MEEALVSVTVKVSVCPDEMLLEPALIETVGTAAAALAAKAETATRVRKGTRDGIVFTGEPALMFVCTVGTGSTPAEWPELSNSFDAGEAALSWCVPADQFFGDSLVPMRAR